MYLMHEVNICSFGIYYDLKKTGAAQLSVKTTNDNVVLYILDFTM